ncbi:conserved hypothetical protein [uncultured Defluviicoccus sp.]|uniref:HhH-GPD domain-containing protein n=1 Tax=metagenome TaxID=256318 RepID=A0A380T9G3_9ZZZZ|nr:conserved hypothetical protein [uncultured Defluviicoccus sp.]
MAPNLKAALQLFDLASLYASAPPRRSEVEWHRNSVFENCTETDLLREAAWVILCSGFRERTVRRIFDHVSLCFCDWESAEAILASDPMCRLAARPVFSNDAKLSAIVGVAYHIHTNGFARLHADVLRSPLQELQKLPFIGPVTVWHLAKNLGLNVAKPDRHLVRVSNALGFSSAEHLCTEIAQARDEQQKVVDLVLWRYLADNPTASQTEGLAKIA